MIFGGNVKIGILGGIGPEATGRFYLDLFRGLQLTGIRGNTDFPQVIVNSIPAPELVGEDISDAQLFPYRTGLKHLDDSDVDFIAMVCNTIHLYLSELQKEIKTPIIDLRKEVRERLIKNKVKKVTVLSTRSAIERGLYNFPEIENIAITSEEINELEGAIIRYNIGKDKNSQIQIVRKIAEKYLAGGADTIILGCTEIALMLKDTNILKIDTMEVLVGATTEACLKSKKSAAVNEFKARRI